MLKSYLRLLVEAMPPKKPTPAQRRRGGTSVLLGSEGPGPAAPWEYLARGTTSCVFKHRPDGKIVKVMVKPAAESVPDAERAIWAVLADLDPARENYVYPEFDQGAAVKDYVATPIDRQFIDHCIARGSIKEVDDAVKRELRSDNNDWSYYIMPDAGESFGALFEKGRTFSTPEICAHLQKLARIITGLHAAGYTHNDIHPYNILLSADGTLRLADFGLAKQTKDRESDRKGYAMFANRLISKRAYGAYGDADPFRGIKIAETMQISAITNALNNVCLPSSSAEEEKENVPVGAEVGTSGVELVPHKRGRLDYDNLRSFDLNQGTPSPDNASSSSKRTARSLFDGGRAAAKNRSGKKAGAK